MKDARQEFEAFVRTIPYEVTRNATGRYKWYETERAWKVWKHQAARIAELESREPRFIWTGTEVDDAMILIGRMDDSIDPERIDQLEKILPRLGARIAELEAQTAHMADLVELANNATERADKLEAQVKALQRVPLSEKQVEDLIYAKHFRKGCAALSYASTQVNLNWYRLGLRDGERAHGITQENQG